MVVDVVGVSTYLSASESHMSEWVAAVRREPGNHSEQPLAIGSRLQKLKTKLKPKLVSVSAVGRWALFCVLLLAGHKQHQGEGAVPNKRPADGAMGASHGRGGGVCAGP